MKVGICFGCYAPMHAGHMKNIMAAKRDCDRVNVVVCGYNGEPRGEEIGMSLEKRYNAVYTMFATDEKVHVRKIDETGLYNDHSFSLDNWKIFVHEVKIHTVPLTNTPVWYVAEESYYHALTKIGETCVLLKKDIPISGTMIRENPVKHFNQIALPFRRDFVKNILITGTACEGKTTLVQDLARTYGVGYCFEYGKEYCMETGKLDKDLTVEDYKKMISKQYGDQILSTYDHPIVVHDTDNIVTLMYVKRFHPDMYEKVHKFAKEYINAVHFDEIFLIHPTKDLDFFDDGIRDMGTSDYQSRCELFEDLCALIKEFYPNAHVNHICSGVVANAKRDAFNQTSAWIEEKLFG